MQFKFVNFCPMKKWHLFFLLKESRTPQITFIIEKIIERRIYLQKETPALSNSEELKFILTNAYKHLSSAIL